MDGDILKIQKKVGVNADFFEKLREEDDWSFIIKLHALLESVCTSLLIFHLNEPEIKKFVSRLELSNTNTGKVALLKQLHLLGEYERRFVRELSTLRNSIVHDVKNSKFELKEFYADLNCTDLKRHAISFSPFEFFIVELEKKDKDFKIKNAPTVKDMIQRMLSDPKEYIWYGAHAVLIHISEMFHYSDYLQWKKAKRLLQDE